MDIEAKIKSIIGEQLNVEVEDIDNIASLIDDMGADSLDIVELIMAMEEDFDMEIPDEDIEKIVTVQDVIDYVKQRLQQAG